MRSSIGGPSHQSSSKVGRLTRDTDGGGGREKQRNRVLFKTSNTPSLELVRNLPEQYTPYTDLDDYLPDISDGYNPQAPDLTLKCKQCNAYLRLDELFDHEQLHRALHYFGFDELIGLSLNKLNTKRSEILKLLLNKYVIQKPAVSRSFAISKINEWRVKFGQLNANYELLKAYIGNRFESRQLKNRNIKLDSKGRCWLGSNDLIVAIGNCSNQNSTYRIQMEDSNVVLEKFGENPNLTYLGVFDGFDGDVASRRCSSQLHLAILSYLSRRNNAIKFVKEAFEFDEINNLGKYEKVEDGDESAKQSVDDDEVDVHQMYHRSFKYAYRLMDKLLARGKDETSRVRWSGASACSCLVEKREDGDWIHMANCGDVEAILVYDSSLSESTSRIRRNFRVLTRLHTINSCIKDRDLIERNGCKLLETSVGQKKICGLYSITRGLGFHGDKEVKKYISPKPSVNTFKIERKYVALVIATKGLWSALNYDQVAELVLNSLPATSHKFKPERPVSPSVRALLSSKQMKLVDKSNLLHIGHDKDENAFAANATAAAVVEENDESEASLDSNMIKKTYSVNDEEDENESTKEAIESIQNIEIEKKAKHRPRTAPTHLRRHEIVTPMPKCNSDIYPYNTSLSKDDELLSIDYSSVNQPLITTQSATEIKSDRSVKQEVARVHHNNRMKPTSVHTVQVDEYELNKWARRHQQLLGVETAAVMRNLDLAESLSEMLANAALLAGSTDNITVSCILLPGSIATSASDLII